MTLIMGRVATSEEIRQKEAGMDLGGLQVDKKTGGDRVMALTSR